MSLGITPAAATAGSRGSSLRSTSTPPPLFPLVPQKRSTALPGDPCAMLHHGLQGLQTKKRHWRRPMVCGAMPEHPKPPLASLWPPLPRYAGHLPRAADMAGFSPAGFTRLQLSSSSGRTPAAAASSVPEELSADPAAGGPT
eukprot:RCo030923